MEKIHTEIQAAMIRRCVTILKYLKENSREQHLSTKMRVIVKRETTTNGPARYFLKVQLSKMVSGKQSVNPVQKSVRDRLMARILICGIIRRQRKRTTIAKRFSRHIGTPIGIKAKLVKIFAPFSIENPL